jgi:protein-L-isoaspartate(D-aspartate) O-methyltransferase
MSTTTARHNMVESQIRTNRITDDLIIEAMDDIPRESYVPELYKGIAYIDTSISLGKFQDNERYILEPLALARLTQAAEIMPGDIALVVGSGAGYAAALIARLADAVVALESDKALAASSVETLTDQGIDTVAVVTGALNKGYAKQAPYDVILFNGAVAEVPKAILKQLAEGGRLVAIVAEYMVGRGKVYTRTRSGVSGRHAFDANAPILPGFEPKPEFVF